MLQSGPPTPVPRQAGRRALAAGQPGAPRQLPLAPQGRPQFVARKTAVLLAGLTGPPAVRQADAQIA